ncbi:MAG: T9SS type A sorting domain-containing protein [Bacteroidales bacterium]|nr:T9SS type A sorting domain-containing protein [Bacteroidales bacterium]
MNLKKTTFSNLFPGLVMILIFLAPFFSMAEKVTYTDSWGNQGITMLQQSANGVTLNFSVKEFNFQERIINGESMKEIELPGNILQNDEGAPNLPSISRYVAIPYGATAHIEITGVRTQSFQNIEVAPAPRIPLETERGPMQYNKNMSIYSKNAFFPAQPVMISGSRKMRGVDVVLINFTPWQYNPVTKELIVYRDLKVNVTFTGGSGEFGDNRLRNRYWDPIIKDNILNPEVLPAIDYNKQAASRAASEDVGFEYLIIVPNDPIFKKWADTIKAFRTEQGILTGIVTLQQVGGNTATIIENYINNAYNTWDIPPVAVLLMADYGTDATNSITSPIWDNYCVSDNIYADVDNDDMPEIVFARMTANNDNQLKIMVQKFKGYEMEPPTDPDFYLKPVTALGWQTERWFQICSEVIGGFWKNQLGKAPVRINAVYEGNPNVDYWSTATNTNTVVNYFGPNGLNYIPATLQELGDWDGGTATDVNNALNAGAFILQHRDHGMETGWGEPSYTNSSISNLTNVGKLSYIMSVNCLTGKYNWTSECFAEKFHRYTYNNQFAGAVGILAASETSYSFVNDTYVWGIYDNMWPDFMPAYGAFYEQRGVLPAFGNCAGKYFLQQSSWPYNTGNKEVTYNLFHHHGDAFLTLFTEVPQQINVTHAQIMISSATTFDVTADEGAFIAFTYNGQIVGTGTATGGPVAIPISSVPIGATVKVVATMQDHYRHYSEFLVISPEGPYVVTESYLVNDPNGNNNQHLDTGEDAFLALAEKNLGNSASENTIVSVQLVDPFISFIDNTEDYGTVPAQEIKTVADGFRVQIANNVPNMHSVIATVTATNGTDTWTSYMMVECWAPALNVGTIIIDDAQGGNGNGRFDAGETVDVKINTNNTGLSMALDAMGSLSLTSGFLTLNNSSYTLGNINPLGSVQAVFNVTVNPLAPAGLPVDLIYTVTSGEYSAVKTFNMQVGLIVEDWETGDFTKFPWTSGGNLPWTITNMGPYEGNYSAKSGTINNSSSSQLIIQYNVPTNDSLRFTYKISSETSKDFLKFYIDNVLKASYTGTVNWSKAAIPVSAGNHTFKWVYSKDGTGVGGSDCAWLDFIIFPVPLITTSYAGADDFICESGVYQCQGNAANYSTVAWTTTGTGTFSNPAILDPIYTPSAADITAGSIVLTLSVTGVSGNSSDDMTLTFQQPPYAYAGPNQSVCYGEGVSLFVAIANNSTNLTWTTSGTGTFNDIHILNPVYIPSEQDAITGSVTLSLIASNQACDPAVSSIELLVHPLPAPVMTGLSSVCESGQDVIYSVPATSNSFEWNVTGGEIVSGAGTNEIHVNWGTSGNGIVSVLESTPFDCSSLAETSVTINPLPTPAINGEMALCSGSSKTYTTAAVTGHSYTWDAGGATIVSGQNTNEVTISWDIPGTYNLVLMESIDATLCGKSATGIVVVSMLPVIPSIPLGVAEVDLYSLGTSDYSVTAVPGNDYTWQVQPAEAGIIAGNGATATVTWNADYRGNATINVKTSNDCGESSWSESITTRVFSSLGLIETPGNIGVGVTPNPNNGDFKLTITTPGKENLSISILNASGMKVFERNDVVCDGKFQENMHINLSAGSYTLKVESKEGTASSRFIVR